MKKIITFLFLLFSCLTSYAQLNSNSFEIKGLKINEIVEKEKYKVKCLSFSEGTDKPIATCIYEDTLLNVKFLFIEIFKTEDVNLKRSAVFMILGGQSFTSKSNQSLIKSNPNFFNILKNNITEKTKINSSSEYFFEGPMVSWYKNSGLLEIQAKNSCKDVPQTAYYLDHCRNQTMGTFVAMTQFICGDCKYRVVSDVWRQKNTSVRLQERFEYGYVDILNSVLTYKKYSSNYILLYYSSPEFFDDPFFVSADQLHFSNVEQTLKKIDQNSSTQNSININKKDF